MNAGLLTPTAEDENVVREELGFSPIDPEVREAEVAKSIAAAQQAMQQQGPPKEQEEFRRKLARTQFVPRRALRPSEQTLDLKAIDDLLWKQRETFEAKVKPLVAEALVAALPDVREAMKDGDPEEIARLDLKLERVAEYVGSFLAQMRAEGYRQLQAEKARGSALQIARARAAGQVVFASEEEKDPPDVAEDHSEHYDSMLEAQKKQLTRRMEARLRAELEDEAIEVVRTGGDADEVVQKTLQRQVESGSLKSDAGSVMTKAFNMGREEFARERGDEVASVEYSAILDERACAACEALDGEQWDFGSDEHEQNVPPNRECEGRGNCRCVLLYNFKEATVRED